MTIKNNQINSNFHQIAVTDANGQVTGIETGGVVLSDAANLSIGGGSAGQALTTDGAGNLSWATIDSANAAYANVAGEAYSVSGANVTGQVADAASADIALSVAGGDIIGEVANAAYATSAGSATVAASANSVTLANVSGAGNIASVNLNGNASTYLSGNGAWATVSAGGYKYTREIHVDPVNGNDTTGTGAYDKPYLTIMKAHSVITSGQAVYLHVGGYTENVTWTKTNTDIIGLSQGGQVNTSGTWIVGTTTGASVRITDVAFNGTFQQNGTGRVFFRRCQVNGAFTKTSGEYLQAIDTDFGTSVSVSSAGQVVIQGGQVNVLTVNNASAVVAVSGLISGAVFTNTAGTLLVDSSIIYSATPTTAAITSSAGTATYLYNTSTATSAGTQARVSLAGFWTVGSSRFDRANSTITGTNLGTISHTDALNIIGVSTLGAVGNVRITGGSNGQVLTTNGSGNLSWTTVSSGGNVAYANVAGVAYSVSGANVTGAVANATFATTAGSAQSVTLANVSGAGNIASVNLNGNGSQVLAGNGAWVTSGGGNVAYADAAGVAYSVAGANVSGQVSSAASADVALSVAGANVSGTVGAASIAYSVNAANISGQVSSAASADVALSVAGANVSGDVAGAGHANIADVANSVSRGNVTGAGNAGQIQWADTAGKLTSNDRYFIGANGTGAINVSRDTAATAISTAVYSNASGPHSVSAKARGTKASPLPAQVGDRAFGMVGTIYTGNGSATYDGVAGWATLANVPGIFFDVTELPTSNTSQYGSKMQVKVSNAQSNLNHFMNFNDDGTLETPKLNVTGTSNLGSVTNLTVTGGSAGQVLTTNGAGVLSFSTVSNVANAGYADISGVANSVSRGNVTGAGNAGVLQWADATGNLTSSDRYIIGANGAGAMTSSRDTTGSQFLAMSYHNTALSSTHIIGRARGSKASPLPVQVGDRIGSIYASAYTGNGAAALDGVTGFVIDKVTGVFMTVTSLPTGNNATPGTTIALSAANSASNTQVTASLTEDGSFAASRFNAFGNVTSFIRSFTTGFQTTTFSSVIAPDVAFGSRTSFTATSDFTFNGFTNPLAGQTLDITIIQDGTGSRVMSSTMKFAGGVKTLSTAPFALDRLSIYYDGANYLAVLTKGYV